MSRLLPLSDIPRRGGARDAEAAQLLAYRGELSRRLRAELAAAEIAEREAEQDAALDNYCAI